MNYAAIVTSVGIVSLSCCLTNTAIENYRLYRKFNPKKFTQISLTPNRERKYDTVKKFDLKDESINSYFDNFVSTITNNIPKENLTNFYNNINTLKINRMKSIEANSYGYYSVINNIINIVNFAMSMYHELFHMSSTVVTKDRKVFSGFHQKGIGISLTEGYTQALTERYFDFDESYILGVKGKYLKDESNNYMAFAYPLEVRYSEALEKIIGKDKMESLYFNADLYGLIEELKKYKSEDEILKFITKLDFLGYNYYNKNKKAKMIERSLIGASFKYINYFLLSSYILKMKYELFNQKIGINEFHSNLEEYISYVGIPINYNEIKSSIFTDNINLELDNIDGYNTNLKDIYNKKIKIIK